MKFKIGDRVRLVSTPMYGVEIGDVHTVSEVDKTGFRTKEFIERGTSAPYPWDYSCWELVLKKATKKGPQKFDSKKPMLAYIPPTAIIEMGKAFTDGAQKYGGYNYVGLETTRTISAAMRHINAFVAGENIDPESNTGAHHLGAAMASLAMCLENLKQNPEGDNRCKNSKSATK